MIYKIGCSQNDRSQYVPSDHVGSLVDVGHTIEESLDTRDSLSEVTLRVVSIVQILSHIYSFLLIIISRLLYP